MRITLKQLQVFVAIAQKENMSHAADTVNLSQSACSMALTSLENQLNGPLFERRGKKLILNERGRILLPKALHLIGEAEDLQNLMLPEKSKELTGHLIVGASSTIGNYVLPEMIGNFLNKYPQTKITLKVANTEQIIQHLLQFDVDLGLIEGKCYSSEIEVKTWKKDELIIVASPKNPLTKKRQISLIDLENEKWILRESGSGTRAYFEEAMKHHIKPFLELGHTEAIKQAVRAGIGISCLSKVTVINELNNGDLVELKTPFLKLTRDFYLLNHQKKYSSILYKEFMQYLSKKN
jgi:DNA-binding transcriptional LysR family regulator